MPNQPYSRPPITEAVIELRFTESMNLDELEKMVRRFKPSYPHNEVIRDFGIEVQIPQTLEGQPRATTTNQIISYRLSAPDAGQIVLVSANAIAVSQLAPYPGWEEYFRRFVQDWQTLKQNSNYRHIQRIGVRFINRLDISFTDERIEQSEYLTVYPQLPSQLSVFVSYGVQAQLPLFDIGCQLTINTAVVPSFLVDHGSILLDIDISVDQSAPQNDEAIYDVLNRIRVKKNEIFELCVTDKARNLFR